MVAELLPHCRSLANSPRRADRMLWLRIATDVLCRAGAVERALGPDWEDAFASALGVISEDDRLEILRKLTAANRLTKRLAGIFLMRCDVSTRWMLEHAPGLPEDLLGQAIGVAPLASAIARRTDLSDALLEKIREEGDVDTLVELARNMNARLSRALTREMVEDAVALVGERGDVRLAQALLRRAPLTVDHAPLFLEATSAQRLEILIAAQRADLGRAGPAGPAPVDGVALERLERHAIEGNDLAFRSELAAVLGCEETLAARIADDPSGEPLAVALCALGAPNDLCVRVLTARDIADRLDYPRLGSLARLQSALSASAAKAVLKAMLGTETQDARKAEPHERRRGAGETRVDMGISRAAPAALEAVARRGAGRN